MDYQEINSNVIQEGVWDEKTCVRRMGGYDIDKTNLPSDLKYLPKGAVLGFNSTTGKVYVIKTVKVAEAALSGATTIKIAKNSLVAVGDTLDGNEITAIDKSNTDYDALTVTAISADIAKDAVLADGNAANAIGLNYATVKIDGNPTCTPTVQAYEIEEDTLPYPVNDTIKTALTCRHAFKL